jgi:hypothetical protein
MDMDEQTKPELETQFAKLSDELSYYTSYKKTFLRGVVYGVGTAIGASIVAAVLLGFLYQVMRPIVESLPLTGMVIDVLDRAERMDQ